MLHMQPRESPAKLFLGRTLSSRLDLVKPNTERDVKSKQFDMANKRGSPLRAFEPGREVIVRDYRKNAKSNWVSGTISEQTGPVTYRVEVAPGQTWRRHIDQIQEFAANVSASDTPITNDISMKNNQGQHTEAYKGCIVTNIRNGSIIVDFTMFYYTKAIMQTTKVRTEISASLKTSTSITVAVTFTVVIEIDTLYLNVLRTNQAEYLSSERSPRFFKSSVAIVTEENTTPIDITTTDFPVTTTATADSPLTMTTIDDEQLTSTTTHSATTQSLETTATTNPPETITTTNPPETITTTNPPETITTTNPPETITTTNPQETIATTTIAAVQSYSEVKMDHAYGEIGQVSNQTCMIEIKKGDWEFVSLKFKESNEDLAVIQSNGSVTIFTTDSLLRPEFNISGSTIKAIVNFDLTNFTSDRCSSRQYTLICSVDMTNGYTFNTSGDFDIIAPLTEPEVTVIETLYSKSLSAAGINAMCNLTKDQSNKTAQALGIQILNSTGDVIRTIVDVTPYNEFTSSCGELVYISWLELFEYRADLNMSTLNCFLENSVSKKTVFSNNITLIFKEQ
ncbi:uncharacterized protein LOC125667469 [Ostrea edulis]|uniref:uncharacterized protein LOC125667469 n=1 Tax=Ostrea edulis TaxID=37623 RepID=UPI0024AFE5A2|nr:uncharacterized protein LOC125667469 [Ostrea edulis]